MPVYDQTGIPLRGFGCQLAYTGHTPDALSPTWDYQTAKFTTPRTMLLYGGDFNMMAYFVNNLSTAAIQWSKSTRLNGATTNGFKCIPIIGFPLCTWGTPIAGGKVASGSSDMTFTKIMSGACDDKIVQLVTMWAKLGWTELVFRLGYEENFNTTPDGWRAGGGINAPSGSYSLYEDPAMAGMSDAQKIPVYCRMRSQMWRYVANLLSKTGAANGVTVRNGWGPCAIGNCAFDPRLMYPDLPAFVALDSYGIMKPLHLPDFYMASAQWTNGSGKYHTGYDKQPPFTKFTGPTPSTPSGLSTGGGGWTKQTTGVHGGTVANPVYTNGTYQDDLGSEYWCWDYWGGYSSAWDAPGVNPMAPLAWSFGWGLRESMTFALQQGCEWGIAEFGAFSGWDGNLYGGKIGPGAAGSNIAANFPECGPYIRSRIKWFQNKSQNGIADGVCYQISFWQNQGDGIMQGLTIAYPELVANPDAGAIATTAVIKTVITLSLTQP